MRPTESDGTTANVLAPGLVELLRCPRCQEPLESALAGLHCPGCSAGFEIADGVPMLFWPNEWESTKDDVTERVKAFYEKTPFPDYDNFDSPASLAGKARQGVFARLLDEQLPRGIKLVECGSGTSQLSCFLSMSNRMVLATDICFHSLCLGRAFARRHGLERVHFVQQNLFRPVLEQGAWDFVLSNGVLHHTSDARLAFLSIARLVRSGGYILIGLYHRYGRLACDARRALFRWTGGRGRGLDAEVRRSDASEARKQAWYNDQYRHPHETKHTIGEVLGWLEEAGLEFVRSIPSPRLFDPFTTTTRLFEPATRGAAFERGLTELSLLARGGRDNGFFMVIARRC